VSIAIHPGGEDNPRWGVFLAMAVSVLGVFWTGYSRVKATNFGGYDEWLLLWLNAKGVFSFPYANRPLVLFWSRPVAVIFGAGQALAGYWFVHGLYLSAAGLVVLALGRRLVPSMPLLSFLAATFAVVWAGIVLSAAFPFALGAALALLGLWALQARRPWRFAALAGLTAAASPIAFLLLVLIVVGLALGRRADRWPKDWGRKAGAADRWGRSASRWIPRGGARGFARRLRRTRSLRSSPKRQPMSTISSRVAASRR
jgi:hypothetical protein